MMYVLGRIEWTIHMDLEFDDEWDESEGDDSEPGLDTFQNGLADEDSPLQESSDGDFESD